MTRTRSPGRGRPPCGVYVHFPYCTHRCPYCDFAVSTEPAPGARYRRAVLRELSMRAPAFAGFERRSLYLGGGTPSLWEPAEVARVVEAAGLPAGAEVTLEANPESTSPARLAAWRAAGVSRISLGVQSFDPSVLRKLGRRHDPGRAEGAVREALRAFENVSVDLIYGARRSSVATARADAERLGRLGVPHVSAYALTLDAEVLAEEVPLGRALRRGRISLPSDEETLAQARVLRGALARHGLARYEISNFARPGFASVHNRLYWEGASYLGVGVGAHGFAAAEAGGVRYGNHRTPAAWFADVEAGRLPTAEEERLGPRQLSNERVMLALRTARGLPEQLVPPERRPEVDSLLRARLASRRRGRLVLTARGLDVHSAVAERLFV